MVVQWLACLAVVFVGPRLCLNEVSERGTLMLPSITWKVKTLPHVVHVLSFECKNVRQGKLGLQGEVGPEGTACRWITCSRWCSVLSRNAVQSEWLLFFFLSWTVSITFFSHISPWLVGNLKQDHRIFQAHVVQELPHVTLPVSVHCCILYVHRNLVWVTLHHLTKLCLHLCVA